MDTPVSKRCSVFMQIRAFAITGALLLLTGMLSACNRPDVASPTQATTVAHAVEKIEIDYEYMGWVSFQEHYVIQPQGDGFVVADNYQRRRARYDDVDVRATRTLPTAKVQHLLDAVDAPVQSRTQGLQAAAQAMSSKALAKAVDDSSEWRKRSCTSSQLKRYTQQLARGGAGYRLLEDYYDSLPWTDDYPLIHVRVHRKGRPVVKLYSRVQQALMLPWQRDGTETWDPGISDALAMLLPMESHAYGRLSRQSLAAGMAGEGIQELKELCGKAAAAPPSSQRTEQGSGSFIPRTRAAARSEGGGALG